MLLAGHGGERARRSRSCSTRSAPARRRTGPRRRGGLLDELDVAVLRGNAGEVATLVGVEAEVRGVESIGGGGDPAELARDGGDGRSALVASVTGPVDHVSDGERVGGRRERARAARVDHRHGLHVDRDHGLLPRRQGRSVRGGGRGAGRVRRRGRGRRRGRQGPRQLPRRALRRAGRARPGHADRRARRSRSREAARARRRRARAARACGRGRRDGRPAAAQGRADREVVELGRALAGLDDRV